MARLTPAEIGALDPYQLMGALGKRVIHPGGRRSTEELYDLAALQPGERVLEVGCGAGTTAVEMHERFEVHVTAVDVDPRMLERARATVDSAGAEDGVVVERGDITALGVEDAYDCVIVEAVTMFVDRKRAAAELVRACRAGGRVLDHEFVWRQNPTAAARHAMEGVVCPGVAFETEADWRELYGGAGLQDVETVTGPFAMMSPTGFLRDEGFGNTLAVFGRAFSRLSYAKRMVWLMSNIRPAMGALGYVVVKGTKPVT